MTAVAGHGWTPYCGAAPVPGDWLTRWNFDPILLVALAGLAALAWKFGRGTPEHRHLPTIVALAALLFVSPFCALTSALFSARVTHHVLLTAAMAPLLALALPSMRARVPGSLSLWTGLQALTFWFWHAPPAYSQALSSDATYWAMQLSLLGTATGFWVALRRSAPLAATAALLVTTVQMGLLGALITFAGAPLYQPHLLVTEFWGLTPLHDQQLAGLIMWVPAAGLYLGAALLLAQRWLAAEASSASS